MMKIFFITLFASILVKANCQAGVPFITGLTWQQVKEKANAENKYIFVDCFTTWCSPCKKMDKEVYADDVVGDYIKNRFISVKLQLDTGKQDDGQVKSWYAIAKELRREFNITAIPTYLFISPDGELVHRDQGYKNTEAFIALLKDAENPERQYFSLIRDYKQGKRVYRAMPYMIKIAKQLKEKELANILEQDYLDNYIFSLPDSTLYSKENIKFLTTCIKRAGDKQFNFIYHHSDYINKAMGSDFYSRNVIDFFILRDDVPALMATSKSDNLQPDWRVITQALEKKYSKDCADRIVLISKIDWNAAQKKWAAWTEYMLEKVEKYGPGFMGPNNDAWDVFLHSNDKNSLSKALEWSSKTLDGKDATCFDTYANLLYKLGRIQEAISWEEKALLLSPNSKVFRETILKMKTGVPTWE